MSKHNVLTEKPATKQSTKPQPTVEPLAGMAELAGKSLLGGKNLPALQLGDLRFSTIQRQMLAGQIGKTQGNAHLQQTMAFLRRHESDAPYQLNAYLESTSMASVQPKLTLGQSNDQYEQETERVAGHAMSMPDSAKRKPGLSNGKARAKNELTAHELTHIVPQTGDAVASHKVIQRYQAGESGHKKIEQEGLVAAGFTADEAAEAYLGNWMRDLSQLDMPWLVELLGLGEFGKPVDASKLGTYVPSEHMDNPDGGNTIEDTTSAATQKDTDARDENKKQLSDSQKKDQEAADAAYADIKAAAAKNRLPAYIERGKFMAKRKLVEAIKKGDTPQGREEMSSALHAVEDYFSHTNFTEAAIWVLAKENPTKYKPLMTKMSKTTLGTSTATVGGLDKKGLPQIISGTYAPGANNKVSQIELLKTELESGALTVALVKGLIMKAGITADDLARKLGEKMGIKPILRTVEGGIGAVVGGVRGAVEGAGQGAQRGGRAGRQLGRFLGNFGEVVGAGIGGTVGGLVGGITGGVSGAKEGKVSGENMGEQDAEAIIKAAGFAIKGGMVVVTIATVGLLLPLFPTIAATLATVIAMAKSALGQKLLDAYAEKKVAESTKEAKAKGLAGPTHSELAKDAPDHPLFDASASLAVEAVRGIGFAMKAAWAQNKANPPSEEPIGTEEVKKQVDKYVCALDSDPWWRPIIEKQAAAAGITTSDTLTN